MQQATITVAKVTVNPDLLTWARTERGLSIADAAQKLHLSESDLIDLENGRQYPDISLLRQMSAKYRISLYAFLLPTRPAPLPKIHDFRTPARRNSHGLRQETLIALQDVREALETFSELQRTDPKVVQLPSLDSVRHGEQAAGLAIRIRKQFGVSVKEQWQWRSPAFARDEWRRRIEALGVFVYFKQMHDEDCRGFSMIHDGLAAICVNDREGTPGAASFTLLHEFCHLLLRKTGISDENTSNATEKYCNRFAGAFLIPVVDLRDVLKSPSKPYDYPDDKIVWLANKFRVSNRAMAFRLEETRLAPEGYYDSHTSAWKKPKAKKGTRKGGPTVVEKAAKALGRQHTKTVLKAYGKGLLSGSEAHGLLDVPFKSFGQLGTAIE